MRHRHARSTFVCLQNMTDEVEIASGSSGSRTFELEGEIIGQVPTLVVTAQQE